MCRLYGFLATEPTTLECSLVAAQNALQTQSDRDSRGVRNADGWGIAHWVGDDKEVIKSTMPAFADDQFAKIASDIWSEAAIAHVRAATIGRVSADNTRPFTFGTWAFAHNGTIPAGATDQPKLNFVISDGRHLAASRWGNTLYWTIRRGIRDCAVCGTSHCPSADEDYRSVVVASEPLTDENWTEVPEASVLGVEPGAHTLTRDLLATVV
jgi:predicted glutamine amidotransferase